jgi:IS30 family transposase
VKVRHLSIETRHSEALEWRRSQVLEYSSEGYSMREIAQKLQVDKSAVSRDIQYLRKQAQENLRDHIQEVIPHEYDKCMTGINQVLKMAWSIVNNDVDSKTRLQALTLINDCNKYKMELSTNGLIISDAIKFLTRQQEQLEKIETIKPARQTD